MAVNVDRIEAVSPPRRRPGVDWLLAALIGAPLAIVLARLFVWTPETRAFLSLADLPLPLHKAVENALFVPLGAAVVVLFRLTLGLKLLGLFRPILLAVAFGIVGVPLALGFLLFVLVAIVALRAPLRGLHAYARVAVLLSVVAALLLVPLLLGKWWSLAWLQELAFFPVIALCLTGESFAKAVDRHGLREAIRRTAATIVVAAITYGITSYPATVPFFMRFPELVLAQAAFILVVTKHLALRLMERRAPSSGGSLEDRRRLES